MRSSFFPGGLAALMLTLVLAPVSSAGTLTGRVQVSSKDGKPLADNSGVVVYLKEVNGNKGFIPSKGDPSMASQDMQFAPGVLAVLAGTSVAFPNKDDAIHNAFSASDTKKFDLGRYGFGESNSVRFDKPGLVNVYCKIHPRMAGYILVLANPYFAVTDKEGNYSLKDVPSGTYQVECWFPFGDGQEKKVAISGDAAADFKLVKLRNSNPRKAAGKK
jgi:plastocyanin